MKRENTGYRGINDYISEQIILEYLIVPATQVTSEKVASTVATFLNEASKTVEFFSI